MTIQTTIIYTPFIPVEVKSEHRARFYNSMGPKYIVEVNPVTRRYQRTKVRLITDPPWYSRDAYVLYNADDAENMNWLEIAGYLVDKLDIVAPERIRTLI